MDIKFVLGKLMQRYEEHRDHHHVHQREQFLCERILIGHMLQYLQAQSRAAYHDILVFSTRVLAT